MIKTNKSYIFIALSIAIILCAAMLFVGLYSTDKVYAEDEVDYIVDFNQLFPLNYLNSSYWTSRNCSISTSDNIMLVNVTSEGVLQVFRNRSTVVDHHYLCIADFNPSTDLNITLLFSDLSLSTTSLCSANTWTRIYSNVVVSTSSSEINFYISSGTSVGDSFYVRNIMLIDLTQMFGNQIPDNDELYNIFNQEYYDNVSTYPVNLNYFVNNAYSIGYNEGYIQGLTDYENNNRIVYFNQLIENENQSVDINHGSNFGLYDIQPITLFDNHKYYISLILPYDDILRFGIDWGSDNFTELISFPTYPLNDNHKYSGIFTGQNTVINNIEHYFAYANNTQSTRFNGLNVIDLTAMYGSNDNIPTLEQLDLIFSSRPYYYNEGTVSYSSSVDQYQIGYINGFNSAYDSQNVVVNSYVIGSNAFPMNYNNVTSTFTFDDTYNQFKFYGYIGIPMGNLVSGTLIDVDFSLYIPGFSGLTDLQINSYSLDFYSYQYTFMNKIGSVDLYTRNGNTFRYKGFISLNTDLDSIYCSLTTGANYVEALVQSSSFTFRTANIQAAIDNAFNEGVQSVYNIYQEGGVRYNQIYNAGKTAGINERNPYTFSALMSSVVEAPLNAVLSIFNFDFLGYNMKSFVTLLLTMCLLLAIVRLFMGNSNA